MIDEAINETLIVEVENRLQRLFSDYPMLRHFVHGHPRSTGGILWPANDDIDLRNKKLPKNLIHFTVDFNHDRIRVAYDTDANLAYRNEWFIDWSDGDFLSKIDFYVRLICCVLIGNAGLNVH